MKWGDKFPPEYVNRLYGMVSRNLSLPFRFVCFTENNDGIRDEVEIQGLPELDLPPGAPERGWRKLTVFKEDFGNVIGLLTMANGIGAFFSTYLMGYFYELKGNYNLSLIFLIFLISLSVILFLLAFRANKG